MRLIILMSTFNGAAFIREQIQSIQMQSFDSWNLIIRDDSSVDNTVAIIQEIARSDKRISLLNQLNRNLGPTRSFDLLIDHAIKLDPDYLMFADQDDFWEPWKLARTLDLMKTTERQGPDGIPVLVHTDLQVVDSHLKLISPSYLKHQNMHNAGDRSFQVLLSQNFITGCTVMVNKPLISVAQPIHDGAIIHDWWYGLCAATTGAIAFDETPSIRYRQHTDNVYGSAGFFKMLFSVKNLQFYLSRKKSNYLGSYIQDLSLRDRLTTTNYRDSDKFRLLDQYVRSGTKTGVFRVFFAIKSGIFQQGLLRNLLYFLMLLTINPSRHASPGDNTGLRRDNPS